MRAESEHASLLGHAETVTVSRFVVACDKKGQHKTGLAAGNWLRGLDWSGQSGEPGVLQMPNEIAAVLFLASRLARLAFW